MASPQPSAKRRGSRCLAPLLAISIISCFLQVFRYEPASVLARQRSGGIQQRARERLLGSLLKDASPVLGQVQSDLSNRDWTSVRSKLLNAATDVRGDLAIRSDAAKTTVLESLRELAGDDVVAAGNRASAALQGRLRGFANHASDQRLEDLREASRQAALHSLKYSSLATRKAGALMEDLSDWLEPGGQAQRAAHAVRKAPTVSAEVRMVLAAASDEFQRALSRVSPSGATSNEVTAKAAAEAVQQIRTVATEAGRLIQIVTIRARDVTSVPRAQAKAVASGVVSRAASTGAGQRVRSAIEDTRERLLRNLTAVEQIQTIASDACLRILAVSERLRAAPREARQGAKAIAAMAQRYVEAIADEALDSIGLQRKLTVLPPVIEEITTDTPSHRRFPSALMLLVFVLGTFVALSVRSRRRSRSRVSEQFQSPEPSSERTSHRTPTMSASKSPLFTPSPPKSAGLGGS